MVAATATVNSEDAPIETVPRQSDENASEASMPPDPVAVSKLSLFGAPSGVPVNRGISVATHENADQNRGSELEQVKGPQLVSPTARLRRSKSFDQPAMSLGDLYNEIEPKYKRLTLGDMDFDALNVPDLLGEWERLKQPGPNSPSSENLHSNMQSLEVKDQIQENSSASSEIQMERRNESAGSKDHSSSAASSPQNKTNHAEQDDFMAPEVLVTTAKGRERASHHDRDDRPDAAKMQDLRRFAYAHGSSRSVASRQSSKSQHSQVSNKTQSKSHGARDSEGQDESMITVGPSEGGLSFSRTSKVAKVLGLKRETPSVDDPKQRRNRDDLTDESDDSDAELSHSATATTARATPSPGPRQVTFSRVNSVSESISEHTAKRALLIKAAHLEVCNHLTTNIRGKDSAQNAGSQYVIVLSGLSFWDRLTDMEKLKSQFTIIDIMHRYSIDLQFSETSHDQVQMRDNASSLHNDKKAMNLDPKTDLPLSTDIDNEVGRSKAAAEYIIEQLSAKLATGTFRDDEDNVFRVPIKGKGPLARVQTDSEWRMVQDAVSAHALGRGYQVQMGDGPEDIARPWQVKQKEHFKEALLSFTRWPITSEQIWIKINRLGVEN